MHLKNVHTHLREHWAFYVVLTLGVYINFLRITGLNFERVSGDLGDTRFIIAIVEYNYQWLIGTYGKYWDGFFMYPDREVISYSDNLLGSLPIYATFRILGFNYLNAFQLLMLTSHILNFSFAYYCFKKPGTHTISAAAGAYIFAFSIAIMGIYNHPQYCFRFAIPVFFMWLQFYLNTNKLKYLFYAAFALVYQFYLGIYLGYFLAVCAMIYLIVHLITRYKYKQEIKKIILDAIRVLPVSLLLFPLFYHYFLRNQVTGYYTNYDFYMQTVPRLSSYAKAFEGSYFWAPLSAVDVHSQFPWLHQMFPGLLIYLSILTAIFMAFKGSHKILLPLVSLTILLCFTTYENGHTMYGYLMKIPGIKSARVVSRIILLAVFFAAWLVNIECDTLLERYKNKSNLIALIVIPFLLMDNYYHKESLKTFTKSECEQRVNALKIKFEQQDIGKEEKIIAFLNEDTLSSYLHQIDAMLCALKIGRRTVNGYSSTCHRYYGAFWRHPNQESLEIWLKRMNIGPERVLMIK